LQRKTTAINTYIIVVNYM